MPIQRSSIRCAENSAPRARCPPAPAAQGRRRSYLEGGTGRRGRCRSDRRNRGAGKAWPRSPSVIRLPAAFLDGAFRPRADEQVNMRVRSPRWETAAATRPGPKVVSAQAITERSKAARSPSTNQSGLAVATTSIARTEFRRGWPIEAVDHRTDGKSGFVCGDSQTISPAGSALLTGWVRAAWRERRSEAGQGLDLGETENGELRHGGSSGVQGLGPGLGAFLRSKKPE